VDRTDREALDEAFQRGERLKANRASTTAEAAVLVRALESARSRSSRLFSDENAKKFLRAHYRFLIELCAIQPFQRFVERFIDSKYPGAVADFVCRTRFIDDAIERGIAQGVRRLVIVGAGYDTRCFRFASRKDLELIEIDHPSTQAMKIKMAKQAIASELLERVQYIPHDLSQATLPVLSAAPTIFLLEGLTGYLPKASIDALFAWMRGASAPGSVVVFTYVDQKFLEGKCTGRAAEALTRYLQGVGEPFRMGWHPAELGRYCTEKGFTLVENVNYLDLGKKCLAPLNRKLHVYEFFNIAIAALHSR
jgi:methyltransferase (TIGR00027 family)